MSLVQTFNAMLLCEFGTFLKDYVNHFPLDCYIESNDKLTFLENTFDIIPHVDLGRDCWSYTMEIDEIISAMDHHIRNQREIDVSVENSIDLELLCSLPQIPKATFDKSNDISDCYSPAPAKFDHKVCKQTYKGYHDEVLYGNMVNTCKRLNLPKYKNIRKVIKGVNLMSPPKDLVYALMGDVKSKFFAAVKADRLAGNL